MFVADVNARAAVSSVAARSDTHIHEVSFAPRVIISDTRVREAQWGHAEPRFLVTSTGCWGRESKEESRGREGG
ncbi:unnamed protein product [Lampetra fluviatilis]